MKKRALTFLLAVVFVVSLLPTVALAADQYDDVSGHWAESSIERFSGYGVVQGSDGSFNPNNSITRAELATIMVNLLQLPAAESAGFTDVPAGAWYEDAVNSCYAAGVIKGYGDGTFGPNDKITRQDSMIMLCRALGIQEVENPDLSGYEDAASVSNYAKGYVAALINAGIVQGTTATSSAQALAATVEGKSNVQRAAIVTMLDRGIRIYANEDGTYDVESDDDATGVVLVVGNKITISGDVGDITISQGAENAEIVIENATVSGAITVNGDANVSLSGTTEVKEVIVGESAQAKVDVAETVKAETLSVKGSESTVEVKGTVSAVTVAETAKSATVTIAETAKTETVSVKAEEAKVEVKAAVSTVAVEETAKKATVTVAETASTKTVEVKAEEAKVEVKGTATSVAVAETAKKAEVVVAEKATVTTVEVKAEESKTTVSGTVTDVAVKETAVNATVTVAEKAKAENVTVAAEKTNVEVAGTVTNVAVEETAKSAAVNVTETAKTENVAVKAEDTKVEVSGTVTKVDVAETAKNTDVTANSGANVSNVTSAADNTNVSGAGKVDSVNANGNNTKVDTAGTNVTAGSNAQGTTAQGGTVNAGSSTTTSGSGTGSTNTGSTGSTGGSVSTPTYGESDVNAIIDSALTTGSTITTTAGTLSRSDKTITVTVIDKTETVGTVFAGIGAGLVSAMNSRSGVVSTVKVGNADAVAVSSITTDTLKSTVKNSGLKDGDNAVSGTTTLDKVVGQSISIVVTTTSGTQVTYTLTFDKGYTD
jgi:hypothetical protein